MSDRQARMQALHREIDTATSELNALLAEEAARSVDDVRLCSVDGPVWLSELFGEHERLLISFNMGQGCAFCTLWADEANGVLSHLQSQAAFVVVSPDTPAEQQAFAQGRGWRFRMVSHAGTDFAKELGMRQDQDGQTFQIPGVQAFERDEDGAIRRVGMNFYGPGDSFSSVFHYLRMFPDGVARFQPQMQYS